MKALRIFWAATLVAGTLVPGITPADAAVTHGIQSLLNTNYTGYVIAADAASPSPANNREHLLVQSRVRTTNPDFVAALPTYYLRYRLLNAEGAPHPIYDSTGVLSPDSTYNLTNSFGISPGNSVSHTNVAALRPAARLMPGAPYTVELRLFTPGGLRETDGASTSPQTFIHFTNVVSGDLGFNVVGTVDQVAWTRSHAVQTDPDRQSFLADIDYTLHRYDNFLGLSGPADGVPVTLTYQLVDQSTGVPVPLATSTTNFTRTLFKYTPPPPDNPLAPWAQSATRTIHVRPASGVQLDSVDRRYRLVVTVSHLEQAGVPASQQSGGSASSSAAQLLHFNGSLRFGLLNTTFTSIDNNPPVLGATAGSHVNSVLSVDSQSGSIPGIPGVHYGDSTDLNVRLLVNGDAVSESGNLPVNIPPGPPVKIANVRMELVAPTTLTPAGLVSSVRVHLPTGLGYRENTDGLVLRRSFLAKTVSIGANLRPLADVVFTPTAPVYAAEENRPLWLETTAFTWRVDEGRIELAVNTATARHVRTEEYQRLAAVDGVLENSQKSLKRSNDRFYDTVLSVSSPVIVQAATNCAARLTVSLALNSGEFRSHFPYDARVAWAGGGSMEIVDGHVDSAGSQLAGVDPIAVAYGLGCTGGACDPGDATRTMTLAPTNGVLRFTRDGGLVAGGNLTAPHRLRWGYIASLNNYAHEAFNFSQANFHMPGHALRGDQVGTGRAHRPATLLYTGVAATNTAYLERPDEPATANETRYERGFADYAGMNVSVGDATRTGHSTLAGRPSGNYPLKGISKYYARRGGVNGIHDAISNSFPPTLTLYGYRFNFGNFGLNCLDNRMQDSHIDGSIEIPYPSEFTQIFAGLRLNCLGGIENAPMPAPSLDHALAYWNGRFDALSLQFRRSPEDTCNVTNAFLTLGARSGVAHVNETLYGTLSFQPDGNLIPRNVGLTDIDSRLKLPNVVRLAGPRSEQYVLNPVADVYFNGHKQIEGAAPAAGWVNIAGKMDVPFFEDLQVHVQTSATAGNSNAPIYVLGGWPLHGWVAGGKSFFTAEYFDADNRGYANNTNPLTYRDSPDEDYHPRARRTWLKVIPFDYPLNWSFVTRDFRSMAPKVNKLMILSTENELKYLSAANAEITFGAQFDGLPQFNFANLAFQAIDFATAAGDDYLTGKLTEMVGGFGRLDEMLSADLEPFFRDVFNEKFQPKLDQIYTAVQTAYEEHPTEWFDYVGTNVQRAFQADTDSIANQLHGLVTPSAGLPGMSVVERLDSYLQQAEQAVTQVESILEEVDGERHIASDLMKLLVNNLAAQFAGGFLDQFVQPILAEADPTLDQIQAVLGNLRTALQQVRTTLTDPAGLGTELVDLFNAHDLEIDATVESMIAGVGDFVHDIDLALDSPVADYTPEEIKQAMRREIEDRFYGTKLAAGIQTIHKHRLYDADAAIRQATDTVFQEINNVMRSVIGQTAQELNNAFTSLIAPLDKVAAAAKINGYAHINGDSLKEARVDVHARIEVGSALEFNGYVQIKELDSQGSAGCSYPGTAFVTEVTLGAEDVQIGWISPDLRASVGTKFTFDDGGDNFPLRGVGGSFELTGKLEYEAFAINFLGASIALGEDENFLSGAAGMRVNKYDVFGGIYFGKTCSIAPIHLWDPEVATLLGPGSFKGIYAYGEGWVPINELIGIPASCLFNISAGLGVGAGVFLDGPTFVAKMTAGVSGEALCLIGIEGKLTGTGVLEGLDLNVLDGLTIKAKGTVGGKIGACPFCLGIEQSVGLTFKQGQWKLDF